MSVIYDDDSTFSQITNDLSQFSSFNGHFNFLTMCVYMLFGPMLIYVIQLLLSVRMILQQMQNIFFCNNYQDCFLLHSALFFRTYANWGVLKYVVVFLKKKKTNIKGWQCWFVSPPSDWRWKIVADQNISVCSKYCNVPPMNTWNKYAVFPSVSGLTSALIVTSSVIVASSSADV